MLIVNCRDSDVTRFVFVIITTIHILPLLAETRANCCVGALHPWQIVPYIATNSPGAVLLTPQVPGPGATTVPVDWPAIVLLLSEAVVTRVCWPYLPGPHSDAEGEPRLWINDKLSNINIYTYLPPVP